MDTDPKFITDDLKQTFHRVYKKHGSVQDRRNLNNKYRHITCQQCSNRGKSCIARSNAFQCANCPPYFRCTRVATLTRIRVMDAMSLTENEYDALLAWYKKSGIAESTKPLIEYVRWVTPSLSEANTNNIPTPSNNIQFRSVPIATKETLYPKNSDRVPDIDGQENASRLEFEDEQAREPHAKLESTTSSSYPVGLHNLSPLPSIAHESIRSEDISRSTISVNCSVPLHAPTAVYKIPKAFYEWGSTADSPTSLQIYQEPHLSSHLNTYSTHHEYSPSPNRALNFMTTGTQRPAESVNRNNNIYDSVPYLYSCDRPKDDAENTRHCFSTDMIDPTFAGLADYVNPFALSTLRGTTPAETNNSVTPTPSHYIDSSKVDLYPSDIIYDSCDYTDIEASLHSGQPIHSAFNINSGSPYFVDNGLTFYANSFNVALNSVPSTT